MALRVLLADESTTIKKVMQLALQDFAVEVKTVHSGVDVVEVARSFQPDIIFADVLLQKRNGYDVCADVKKDIQLRTLPVVLMWSSFMDLDERSFVNARANGKLEKPFDVESLRALILELVPKTQSQRLAHFLRFPASFVEPLGTEERLKPAQSTAHQSTTHQPASYPSQSAPHPMSSNPVSPNPAPPGHAAPGSMYSNQMPTNQMHPPQSPFGAPPGMSHSPGMSHNQGQNTFGLDSAGITPPPRSPQNFHGNLPPLSTKGPEPMPPQAPTARQMAHTPVTHPVSPPQAPPQAPLSSTPAGAVPPNDSGPPPSKWNMESFDNLHDYSLEAQTHSSVSHITSTNTIPSGMASPGGVRPQETTPQAASRTSPQREPPQHDDDDFEPMRIARLGSSANIEPVAPKAQPPADDTEPWSHQDLARFKLDIPQEDVEKDEISLVFDIEEKDAPVDGTEFLLNKTNQQNKRQQEPQQNRAMHSNAPLPKMAPAQTSGPQTSHPTPEPAGLEDLGHFSTRDLGGGLDDTPLELTLMEDTSPDIEIPHRKDASGLHHIGEVRGVDGEMISQFSAPEQSGLDDFPLHLEAAPPPRAPRERFSPLPDEPIAPPGMPSHVSGGAPYAIPTLSAVELEMIIRAQSQEIIEAVVQRIVPDIATELIKKEIDRLLRETPGGGGGSR